MSSSHSKVVNVQTYFQTLAEISVSLNSASDELTKTVCVVDEALKKLSIGLPAWVVFRDRGYVNDLPHYNHDQIGYCKIGGVWGIAIRHVWGDYDSDDQDSEGPWLFNDAPRHLRIQSVDGISDLIEELAAVASKTTEKIKEKTNTLKELAGAIQNAGKTSGPPPAAGVVQRPPASPAPQPRQIPPPPPPPPLGQAIVVGKNEEGDK